jgi:hypothetical protein
MHNLLKFNNLKDAKTIQKTTPFVQKKAGIPWFKNSDTAHGFRTDPEILGVFFWNFAGKQSEGGISLYGLWGNWCWHSVGCGVSPLFQASFCQKFHRKIQRHSFAGGFDGSREHRDHPYLFEDDGLRTTKNCGQGCHLVRRLHVSYFFVFLVRQKSLKKLEKYIQPHQK